MGQRRQRWEAVGVLCVVGASTFFIVVVGCVASCCAVCCVCNYCIPCCIYLVVGRVLEYLQAPASSNYHFEKYRRATIINSWLYIRYSNLFKLPRSNLH